MNFEEISDPLEVVDNFRLRAEKSGLALPEAMTLATIGESGRPQARVVLLKGRTGRELHFYTNYSSPKARELAQHPFAALCIHYPALQLQSRIEGRVSRLLPHQSDEYFATRPRESQIGAWASKQSENLASREALDAAYAAQVRRFDNQLVPRPPHWGGFRLEADRVELWVGQGARLHDRAEYKFRDDAWSCQRLYP